MSDTVRVTNRNNAWHVKDRYGGIEYVIKAGESLTMPRDAAEHIFGYGLDQKGRHQKLMRMGIANLPKGKEMFERIDIKPLGNVKPTGVVREAA